MTSHWPGYRLASQEILAGTLREYRGRRHGPARVLHEPGPPDAIDHCAVVPGDYRGRPRRDRPPRPYCTRQPGYDQFNSTTWRRPDAVPLDPEQGY